MNCGSSNATNCQPANKVYVKEGKQNLKTTRQSHSNIKSLLIFFFDRRGKVHHEFFRPTSEARGINGQCYLNILEQLHAHMPTLDLKTVQC